MNRRTLHSAIEQSLTAAPAQTPWLTVTDRDGVRGPNVPLDTPRLVIGRMPGVGLHLDNPVLSRRHAELLRDPFGDWRLRDLNSRNGTRVNGVKLAGETPLADGDQIAIGPYVLHFHTGDARRRPSRVETATHATITDLPTGRLETFDHRIGTSIDIRHLAGIDAFGGELLALEAAGERLEALCKLLIGELFNGHSVMALTLELDAAQSQTPPQVILGPLLAEGHAADETPYVSRTLLTAVVESGLPTIAASQAGEGNLELSMTPSGSRHAPGGVAVAVCPLRREGDTLDMVYITLPGAYGNAQWLALLSLAVKQFQQAEAQATMRRNAVQRLAIENDLRRARSIQSDLVPRRMTLPGLEVAVGFEPCRWVGGDYADAAPMPDGRSLLFLGDVSGKGLPAALITSSLHAMLHALLRSGATPEELMRHLNEHLCEFLQEGSFVTAVAVCLGPDGAGDLCCVNAGHMQPVIASATGETRLVPDCDLTPLGIMAQPIAAVRDALHPGEMLMLYSDGLSEMRCGEDGAMLGVAGVEQLLGALRRDNPHADAPTLCELLTLRLNDLHGDRPADDDRTFLIASLAQA